MYDAEIQVYFTGYGQCLTCILEEMQNHFEGHFLSVEEQRFNTDPPNSYRTLVLLESGRKIRLKTDSYVPREKEINHHARISFVLKVCSLCTVV